MGRLVLLSGLPGSGKSTLACALCSQARAVHLRVDTIEQAICDSLLLVQSAVDAGYRVAAAQAKELTAAGHDVVCDAVNADARGREIWPRADLIIHVRVPDAVRARRIAERGRAEYPHVWEPWAHEVLTLDGRTDPAEMTHTVWRALKNTALRSKT